jgi:SAM-dependent methyltransferase
MNPLQSIEDHLAERFLSSQALTQHRAGKVSKQELLPFLSEITEISGSYVSHSVGKTLASPITSVRSAEAYALYYTPINAAKVLHLLPILSLPRRELRVLDLGSGPGTAGLALLALLDQPLHLTCVEHSAPMRTVAQRLLSTFHGPGQLQGLSILPALPSQEENTFDLIIAANVLAELNTREAEDTALTLSRRLADKGHLVMIEPGQQLHTRRLMSLRDKLFQSSGEFTPTFPCLRLDSCPMLASSESDWCHGTLEWDQPRLNAHLDDLLSFNKHRIKYSAIALQRGGALRDGVRVITPPTKARSGVEALVCGKDTYGIVRIRKGTRSPNNRAFEKASVFDRLVFSRPCVGDLPEDVAITDEEG